jgi:hypothetical protein
MNFLLMGFQGGSRSELLIALGTIILGMIGDMLQELLTASKNGSTLIANVVGFWCMTLQMNLMRLLARAEVTTLHAHHLTISMLLEMLVQLPFGWKPLITMLAAIAPLSVFMFHMFEELLHVCKLCATVMAVPWLSLATSLLGSEAAAYMVHQQGFIVELLPARPAADRAFISVIFQVTAE